MEQFIYNTYFNLGRNEGNLGSAAVFSCRVSEVALKLPPIVDARFLMGESPPVIEVLATLPRGEAREGRPS